MWDLPGPGLEPVSPELAGGLSTTAPPGKPHELFWLVSLKSPGAQFSLGFRWTFGNTIQWSSLYKRHFLTSALAVAAGLSLPDTSHFFFFVLNGTSFLQQFPVWEESFGGRSSEFFFSSCCYQVQEQSFDWAGSQESSSKSLCISNIPAELKALKQSPRVKDLRNRKITSSSIHLKSEFHI